MSVKVAPGRFVFAECRDVSGEECETALANLAS